MQISLILSAMFGIAFSALVFDPTQAGKKYCTFQGHKIELEKSYYPPRECFKLYCSADSTGKRVEGLDIMTCGIQVIYIQSEKDKKLIKPQPSLDLKYPDCCPVIYKFAPDDDTKKFKSGKKNELYY